jgi:AcrR family transcriptional regulator
MITFSELGFQGATTRMICERAQANPAAVNYHFGDKLGLYLEILKAGLGEEKLRINGELLLEMEPEAALGHFISRFFHGLMGSDGDGRSTRIIGHELLQPSPALAIVVEQIIRPQARTLCEIIARITGCPPESLKNALAAQGIIAQVTQYMNARPLLNLLWPQWPAGAGTKDEIVAHVTAFSLAGLRALSASEGKAKVTTRRRGSRGARRP